MQIQMILDSKARRVFKACEEDQKEHMNEVDILSYFHVKGCCLSAQCFERFKTYFQEIGILKCSSTSDSNSRYNNEGIDDKDLIISKLLRQDIQKYRS